MSDRQYTEAEIEAALNGDPVDEVEEPNDEEESAPAEEAPEADPEPEAEPEPEEEPEAPVEDDWELKYRKLQAAKDREIAQVQREAREAREEAIRLQARQEALAERTNDTQSAEIARTTVDDLRAGLESYGLPHTFQWTVANRPDLVPALISTVRNT